MGSVCYWAGLSSVPCGRLLGVGTVLRQERRARKRKGLSSYPLPDQARISYRARMQEAVCGFRSSSG